MKQSGNSLMENYFFLLSKKQSSSIGVGRRHPERIKRVYFLAQKNPDPATNISYMIHSFSCTAWKPFERSPLEKERPWQVTKKSFSIFQKLSCKLSPHICIFFQSRKKRYDSKHPWEDFRETAKSKKSTIWTKGHFLIGKQFEWIWQTQLISFQVKCRCIILVCRLNVA